LTQLALLLFIRSSELRFARWDEKMRPLKVVGLILSLFKECQTSWAGYLVWFG